MLRNVVGATWYLLVATFGLLGIVVLAEGRALAARLRRGEHRADVVTLIALLLVLAGLIVITAIWFVDPTRRDQILYGRYIEPVVPPLIALGVVTVTERLRRTDAGVVAGVIAGLTALVAILVSPLAFGGANRWNLASLPFPTFELQPLVIVGAGVAAIAGGAVALAGARRSPWTASLALVVLFVPIIAFSELRVVEQTEDDVYAAGWESPQAVVEALSDEASYDASHYDNVAVKVYEWFLPDTRFELFEGNEIRPPTTVFFSSKAFAREHPEIPAHVIWRDPGERPGALDAWAENGISSASYCLTAAGRPPYLCCR